MMWSNAGEYAIRKRRRRPPRTCSADEMSVGGSSSTTSDCTTSDIAATLPYSRDSNSDTDNTDFSDSDGSHTAESADEIITPLDISRRLSVGYHGSDMPLRTPPENPPTGCHPGIPPRDIAAVCLYMAYVPGLHDI